ncbi:hypothetical protein [Alkalimarinus sediminis]|uniref:Uncharacterized protein n=1 Tax=Alkalimarinus sediminis TaxID=1632866 RepID=A0A9E8KQX4_9ALTE|nr:hypothetical protein [Alkalimarinus sediminis]UZW76354.1 hypothetical protein NNL22_07145 [Alkalimarinus sediminis]
MMAGVVHWKTLNKAKQHQPLRGLDSLAAALFVHGYAIMHKNHNYKSAVVGSVKCPSYL